MADNEKKVNKEVTMEGNKETALAKKVKEAELVLASGVSDEAFDIAGQMSGVPEIRIKMTLTQHSFCPDWLEDGGLYDTLGDTYDRPLDIVPIGVFDSFAAYEENETGERQLWCRSLDRVHGSREGKLCATCSENPIKNFGTKCDINQYTLCWLPQHQKLVAIIFRRSSAREGRNLARAAMAYARPGQRIFLLDTQKVQQPGRVYWKFVVTVKYAAPKQPAQLSVEEQEELLVLRHRFAEFVRGIKEAWKQLIVSGAASTQSDAVASQAVPADVPAADDDEVSF